MPPVLHAPPGGPPARIPPGARWRCLAAAALLVPVGLATKAWTGPAAGWVHDSAGGVVYVMFWTLVVQAWRPAWRTSAVAAGVFAATCALEIAQLWHPPWLEALRATRLGAALLGATFSWLDFPHYAVGAILGALLTRRLVSDTKGS